MSKPLIDGLHLLPCGAELTIAGGKPVSVRFRGASADDTQREIEDFAELWIDDIVEDDVDGAGEDDFPVRVDDEQPTHLFTDHSGSRRVAIAEGNVERHGELIPSTLILTRYEEWLPYLVNGVWYNSDGDIIEATLVALTPEVEA